MIRTLVIISVVLVAGCTSAQQRRRWEGAAWASLGCAAQAAANVLAGVGEIVKQAEEGVDAKAIGLGLATRHGIPLARCIVERAVVELVGGEGIVPAGSSSPAAHAVALWLQAHPDEWARPAATVPLDVRGVPADAPR